MLTMTSSSSEKRKNPNENSDDHLINKIGGLSGHWENDNELKREANEIQRERITFERESFSQRMELDNKKMALAVRRMEFDEMGKVLELNKELDQLEDQLEVAENPRKKMRLQSWIEDLELQIQSIKHSNRSKY